MNILKTPATAFLFLYLLMTGCIDDDMSECGVSLHYQYTRNVDGVDKFPSEVKKVNLYIFDAGGIFLDEYQVDEKQLSGSNNTVKLNLPPGKYNLVAWGNLCNDYELPVFEKGKTTMTEAVLSLKRAANTVTNHPEHLFFGSLSEVDILPALWKNQVMTIDMMKDTKKIRVIAKGLSREELSKSGFSCRISSVNGDYRFDNSIKSSDTLLYIPNSSVDEQHGYLVSDFVIMRELNDASTQSRLIITYHNPSGGPDVEIKNISLTELLLSNSKTKDLDIEDYFEIELTLDFTSGSATITIKGWGRIDFDNVVG
jgi:hypothetical protein